LRKNEPELERPYQAPGGRVTGYLALLLSIGIGALYFPGSPSALVWPQEWGIILFWILLGAVLFGLSRVSSETPATINPDAG
jgi:fatty acid desaturase